MKRRVVTQVFQRYDTCLFCAYRVLRASVPAPSRFFTVSASLSHSPAPQQDGDNESHEFSMLKQNAGRSFPSRSKPVHNIPHSVLDASSSRSPTNDNGNNHSNEAGGHWSKGQGVQRLNRQGQTGDFAQISSRTGRHQNARRDRNDQATPGDVSRTRNWRQNNDHQYGGIDNRSRFQKETGNSNQDRANYQGRKSFQQNRTPSSAGHNGEPGTPNQSTSNRPLFRRLVINDNTPPDEPGSQGFNSSSRASNPRPRRTGSDASTLSRHRQTVTMDQSTNYRRKTASQGPQSRQNRHMDSGTIDGTGALLAGDAQPVVAPAEPSLDTAEEFHRRRGRADKRNSRSDRYVDMLEEGDIPAPSTAFRKSSNRGRNFDYDAFEAEDALYAEGSRKKKKGKGARKSVDVEPTRPTLQLPEFVSVERLARMLKVDVESFIRKLEEEGFEDARYDHILDSGTSAMFADLYGFEPLVASDAASDLMPRPLPEDLTVLPPRPPIVTIMGHVDHGKTTILDYLRKSSVVASEHGGITQHIGAFSVTMPGTNRQITFLDTPGHAAFLEMRRRGANVTDIVVLVVAADDSVKPQTVEAIKHSLEANVQLIVAINKIDKPDADIERVKQDLTRHDIVVEDYGGDYQVIPVSGKTGQGMSDLEEAIITLADVNDYRAESDGPAEGWIIESKVTIAGRVATILVRRGTLHPGDVIVAGTTWARVRTLRNDAGDIVDEAAPGTPVQVDGWRGIDPTAGLEVLQANDENHAKDVVDLRLEQEENMKTVANMSAINTARSDEADARAKVIAWEREQTWSKKTYGLRPKDNEGWVEAPESSGPKKIHFLIKADVAGSVEALVAAVSAIGNNEIVTNVIHSGTGLLTESDMRMLATTGEKSYAISFNQSVDNNVGRLAEAAGLTILDHNIIYKVTDNVKEILADHLPPIITQRVLGEAEVGQIFEITMKRNKVKIAGCRVTNGTISRSHKVRVQRGGETVFTGSLSSLKNVKKDVTEMRKGTECGMGFEEWEAFEEGDQIQCFEEHEERRTLF